LGLIQVDSPLSQVKIRSIDINLSGFDLVLSIDFNNKIGY